MGLIATSYAIASAAALGLAAFRFRSPEFMMAVFLNAAFWTTKAFPLRHWDDLNLYIALHCVGYWAALFTHIAVRRLTPLIVLFAIALLCDLAFVMFGHGSLRAFWLYTFGLNAILAVALGYVARYGPFDFLRWLRSLRDRRPRHSQGHTG